eukprot:14614392-Alexandrium_andersonii.AAC.1
MPCYGRLPGSQHYHFTVLPLSVALQTGRLLHDRSCPAWSAQCPTRASRPARGGVWLSRSRPGLSERALSNMRR